MNANSFVPKAAGESPLAEALSSAGYKLLHALGTGGGGPVYKAIQRSTGQAVAIKLLSVDHLEPTIVERRIERFQREIAVCSGLYHPDIVRLLDSGRLEHEQHFAVFEYIPGTTLAEVLRQEGALGVQRARALLLQLLAPLAHAHDKGIAHRDLKPANIMVTPDGGRDRLKVLDFGISIATSTLDPNLTRLTLSHEWVGTPAYAAPEQLRGEGNGIKADLYAWGLIFVECLTGAGVVRGRSLAEIVESQLQPTAHALPPALAPHRLGKLLGRVLDKDPARRPADASLIQSLLERLSVTDLEGPRGYLRDNPSGAAVPRPAALTDTLLDERREPQVEQRHATVLCCRVDVVGSTPHAEELDAHLEDATELVGEVMRQFGAGPVYSLGMYSLSYFGLTRAREEDMRMALRAGLELASRHEIMQCWLDGVGVRLRLRLGIHSGPVTARIDSPGRQPIHGVTARTAMQLVEHSDQARDVPARILVTQAFRNFVSRHGEFELYSAADGASPPVYHLIGESHAADRDAERLPLFGRAAELEQLIRAHRAARDQGGAVLLVGEAGIGKSRLARELMDQLLAEGVTWMRARCLPEWQHAFLRPLTELVKTRLGISGASGQEASAKVALSVRELGLPENEAVPLFCVCFALPLPSGYAPLTWSPQKQRQRLHQCLADALLAYMRRGVALLIEDIHWGDPSSLECLDTLLQRAKGQSVFVVLTARPGAAYSWSAAPRVLALGRLEEGAIKELAKNLLPAASQTQAVLDQIAERSDGVPLFAEELAFALRGSAPPAQSTVQSGTSAVLPNLAVPSSLRALLTSRLDEAAHAKPMAQFAAALGREFSLERLAAVLQQDELGPLADLEQLVSAGVLVKRRRVDGSVYAFRHALIRDNAYDSMSGDQRQHAHRRIALGMELHPTIGLDQPDVLAQHWECAGEVAKAVHHWLEAARRSRLASAHLEALAQLERALRLIDTLPPSPALEQRRAELLLALGATLVAKRGYTDLDAKAAFERVATLFPGSEGSIQIAFEARFGLWHYYSKRVDAHMALRAARELGAIAERSGDGALQTSAYQALCNTHFALGNLTEAILASRQCEASYDFERHRHLAAQRGDDPHLSALSFEAVAELLRGAPQVALSKVEQALGHAERLGYPAMQAGMACQAAWLFLIWGTSGALSPDVQRVREHARRSRTIASEQGFPFWEVVAMLLEASGRVASGEQDAIGDLLLGVELRRRAGATVGECWLSCFISSAQRLQGKHAEAVATLEAALAYCERDHARPFEAEVHRNLAEVLLDSANPERDVERGLFELESADAVALKYGTGWWRLAIAVSKLRFTKAVSDVHRLGALLEPMQANAGEPPLVGEARLLLEESLRATASGPAGEL